MWLSSLKKKTVKLTPAKKRHERALQEKGVDLVVADCGLFGPFHEDFRKHLKIPFIGTALDLIPLLQRIFPTDKQIAVITGDTRIITRRHLMTSGIDSWSIDIVGMEHSSELSKGVIKGSSELDVSQMRQGVLDGSIPNRKKHRRCGAGVQQPHFLSS